ncbi:hypothetical protein BT69DRAFT_1348985 [Atractiella rhizophila]|nr:hypothetical protein BT69DRAFT_1348985 [Atractiella rhizophila]
MSSNINNQQNTGLTGSDYPTQGGGEQLEYRPKGNVETMNLPSMQGLSTGGGAPEPKGIDPSAFGSAEPQYQRGGNFEGLNQGSGTGRPTQGFEGREGFDRHGQNQQSFHTTDAMHSGLGREGATAHHFNDDATRHSPSDFVRDGDHRPDHQHSAAKATFGDKAKGAYEQAKGVVTGNPDLKAQGSLRSKGEFNQN